MSQWYLFSIFLCRYSDQVLTVFLCCSGCIQTMFLLSGCGCLQQPVEWVSSPSPTSPSSGQDTQLRLLSPAPSSSLSVRIHHLTFNWPTKFIHTHSHTNCHHFVSFGRERADNAEQVHDTGRTNDALHGVHPPRLGKLL